MEAYRRNKDGDVVVARQALSRDHSSFAKRCAEEIAVFTGTSLSSVEAWGCTPKQRLRPLVPRVRVSPSFGTVAGYLWLKPGSAELLRLGKKHFGNTILELGILAYN